MEVKSTTLNYHYGSYTSTIYFLPKHSHTMFSKPLPLLMAAIKEVCRT